MVEDIRAASLQQWQGVAPGWERHAERVDSQSVAVTEWMLDAAGVQPGMRVLELACGPAGVGLAASRAVGDEGTVVSTDFAQPMVEAARRRAGQQGAANMEFRVVDALDMELGDEEFDAALCRFGYMLMPDPGRALAETLRVLRPGGRLALAAWEEPGSNPWVSIPVRAAMEELEAPPPDPEGPGIFAFADPERVRGLLEGAGFEDVRVEGVAGEQVHDSPDAWWSMTVDLAGPLATILQGLPEEKREAIRSRALAGAEGFVTDDGLRFPMTARVAAGRRPS